jgi:hypothetical protein
VPSLRSEVGSFAPIFFSAKARKKKISAATPHAHLGLLKFFFFFPLVGVSPPTKISTRKALHLARSARPR